MPEFYKNSSQELPSLSQIIKKYNLSAKKSLGQNFLLDNVILEQIISDIVIPENATIIEIGGGPGGLTRAILKNLSNPLLVIEKDERAVLALNELKDYYQPNHAHEISIHHGDAIKADITKLAKPPYVIIANLPYNIANQLLVGWLEDIGMIKNITASSTDGYSSGSIALMRLMFQKEVANRLTARPSSKSWGKLSVLVDLHCRVRNLFDIAPENFVPPPKIWSSVLEFSANDYYWQKYDENQIDWQKVSVILNHAFSERRKMIRSSLAKIIPDVINNLAKIEIDSTKRAENLTTEDFINISKLLSTHSS